MYSIFSFYGERNSPGKRKRQYLIVTFHTCKNIILNKNSSVFGAVFKYRL